MSSFLGILANEFVTTDFVISVGINKLDSPTVPKEAKFF